LTVDMLEVDRADVQWHMISDIKNTVMLAQHTLTSRTFQLRQRLGVHVPYGKT